MPDLEPTFSRPAVVVRAWPLLLAGICGGFLTACAETPAAIGTKHPALQAADAHPDGSLGDAGTAAATDATIATAEVFVHEPDTAAATAALIAARPYTVQVPKQYDPKQAWPLLVGLHGYGESGAFLDGWLAFSKIVDKRGFLYATPDGLVDNLGLRYWNATDACCDVFKKGGDDVAYLRALLDDMAAKFNVDPKRVYLVGHSNGGFFAHRLACDLADRVAGVISIAGTGWSDTAKCKAAAPVAVLQVHGTLDAVIQYGGGTTLGVPYPGAQVTVADWAKRNGCGATPTSDAKADLDVLVPGTETDVRRWTGCKGGAAELWQVHGASHFPKFPTSFADTAWTWLEAHARP